MTQLVTEATPTMAVPPPPGGELLSSRLGRALGDDYDLGGLIGRGGMGEVYRAYDRRLRRAVAVKVLLPHLVFSPDMRARFVREAQTAAGLSHPNIVTIFDVGSDEELVWFVMSLVDGESLWARVQREGKQSAAFARQALSEIAQALAYAHARGIVHRDVKPDNILIDAGSGRALISDFGIARIALEGDGTLTGTGAIVGTPRYLSPEQATAMKPIDGRADMYALGLVGCFLLEGEDAIRGENLIEVLGFHVKGSEVDLERLGDKVPVPLRRALERCLRHARDERYARMEEFVEALREAGQDLPEIPPPVRTLIRQFEQALVTFSITILGLGAVGTEKVSPAFIVLILGAVFGQWIVAVEAAKRRGLRWPAVRRALEIERARRVEEVRQTVRPHSGPLGMIVLILTTAGFVELLRRTGWAAPTMLNRSLLFVGMAGVLLTGGGFGVGRIRRETASKSDRVWFATLVTVFLTAWQIFLRWQQPEPRPALWRFLLAVAAADAVALMFFLPRPPRREEDEKEWRVPKWIDAIGGVVFGR